MAKLSKKHIQAHRALLRHGKHAFRFQRLFGNITLTCQKCGATWVPSVTGFRRLTAAELRARHEA